MNSFFKVISFALMLTGSFILLKIELFKFVEDLGKPLQNTNPSIKKQVLITTGKKKENRISTLMNESKATLKIIGKEEMFPSIMVTSLLLSCVGMLFGYLINNIFIAPVFAFTLALIPFLYVKILGVKLKKQLNDELETALSIITSSYVRTESIIVAIEENTAYINPPARHVFDSFLIETKLISPDIKRNLSNMKDMIDNDVYKEWCDTLIACQDDKNIKTTLLPIIKKLSNVRLVSARLDTLLYAPVKEYLTMVVLLVANIPLLYFLNKDWFNILMFHMVGKIVLSIYMAVILLSALAVLKITRPIEYKR